MSDQTVRNIVLGTILVLAFFIVSYMDADEEKLKQSIYCENVKDGLWPDYKVIYQEECEKE